MLIDRRTFCLVFLSAVASATLLPSTEHFPTELYNSISLKQVDPKSLWNHHCRPDGSRHEKDGFEEDVRRLHATEECEEPIDRPFFGDIDFCDDVCWDRYIHHTYGHGINPAQGVTGIVCILLGLYFILFGFRFFRPTLALTGFVFFACLAWIGLANSEPGNQYPRTDIVYICVSTGIGIVGGIVLMLLYTIAIYFVGALAGLFLAVFVLSWKTSLVIQVVITRACFTLGLAIAMIALVFLAERYAIIFATAFTGAYLFILGMDLFVHTGFVNAWLLNFDGNRFHEHIYLTQTRVYIMLAFVLFIALLSTGWQYYWCVTKLGRFFGVNVAPKQDEKA